MGTTFQRYLAEALGTFILVFVGAGAVLANAFTNGGVGSLGIALAHGFALFIAVSVLAHVSGAHVNPAVSFAMFVAGKQKLAETAGYIVSQLVGAVVAALFLYAVFPTVAQSVALGTPTLAAAIGLKAGLLLEALLTFLLVLTVFAVSQDKRVSGTVSALAIGFTLAVGVIVGGAVTGGALNPARAFGPALVAGSWATHWLWWVGPLVGGGVAALLYKHLFMEKN